MNKMALALKRGLISGGMWGVSGGNLAPYLTDRIGNFPEFEPYFDLYSDLDVEVGYLGVAIVEYDETSPVVPLIEKQQTRDAGTPSLLWDRHRKKPDLYSIPRGLPFFSIRQSAVLL
jgi:hypothetical protein